MFEIINGMHGLGYAAAGLSSIFWTLTYALIVRRAALDKRPGMPLAALGANLAWELVFLTRTLASGDFDVRLGLLIPWALVDIVIAWQCFRYGRQEHAHPLLRRGFPYVFVVTLVTCGALTYGFVVEFDDAIGWYAAFGANLMMSVLFVALFFRRGSMGGQSVAIAVCKLLGTFFAFLLALFWSPNSLHVHWASMLPDAYYPIAPLIGVLYFFILLFDVLYVALLVHSSRRQGLSLLRV